MMAGAGGKKLNFAEIARKARDENIKKINTTKSFRQRKCGFDFFVQPVFEKFLNVQFCLFLNKFFTYF